MSFMQKLSKCLQLLSDLCIVLLLLVGNDHAIQDTVWPHLYQWSVALWRKLCEMSCSLIDEVEGSGGGNVCASM